MVVFGFSSVVMEEAIEYWTKNEAQMGNEQGFNTTLWLQTNR